MLLALAILLLLFWIGGFAFSAVGSVIHLLVVLAPSGRGTPRQRS